MRSIIELTLRTPEHENDLFNRLPHEDIEGLSRQFPELKSFTTNGVKIKTNLAEKDPRISELVLALWKLGKRPVVSESLMSRGGTLAGDTYCVIPMQYAEAGDLSSDEFVQLKSAPENGIGTFTRGVADDGSRFWFLSSDKLRPIKRFGYLNQDLFGCSEEFRLDLVKAGFFGIDFIDPPLNPDPTLQSNLKLYFLSATTVLPPVRNALFAYRDTRAPNSAIIPYNETDGSKGCFIGRDYRPPTLRFDAGAFAALGDFDIARTFEDLGEPEMYRRPKFVVSQRFRRWLDAQGLECTYHPIRLENPGDPEPDPPLAAICRELGMPLSTVPG